VHPILQFLQHQACWSPDHLRTLSAVSTAQSYFEVVVVLVAVVVAEVLQPTPRCSQHQSRRSCVHAEVQPRDSSLHSWNSLVVLVVTSGQPACSNSQHQACLAVDQVSRQSSKSAKQSYGTGVVEVVAGEQPSVSCSQHHSRFLSDHSSSSSARQSNCCCSSRGSRQGILPCSQHQRSCLSLVMRCICEHSKRSSSPLLASSNPPLASSSPLPPPTASDRAAGRPRLPTSMTSPTSMACSAEDRCSREQPACCLSQHQAVLPSDHIGPGRV